MDYKSSEIKAGIFIIISIVLFIVFLAIIIGMNSFSEKVTYLARFEYVGGIEKGSAVRYAGLQVGSVMDVRLTDDGFPGAEVVIQVEKETPIRVDSRAFMTTIGIMGSAYVEVTAGTPTSPRLEPGSLISSEDVTGFAQMTGVASNAIDEMTALLSGMNDLLNEHNRKRISSMITSLDEIAGNTEQSLQITLDNMNTLIDQVNNLVLAAENIVAKNDTTITNSVEALETLLDEGVATLTSVENMVSKVDETLLTNQQQYNQIITNLNTTTENLTDFSQTIKERPWSLVRKSAPAERALD
jgi:phospholipid/cholesterol/gamma-HCH transport system substrate-binding protein